jgi:integrase
MGYDAVSFDTETDEIPEEVTSGLRLQSLPRIRGTTTLRDVHDLLAKLPDRDAKLQISAINTVARASGCAPDDLPANPAQLRPHLASLSAAMAGLTRGSWSSVRSRLLKALQRVDVLVMDNRRTKPLPPEWDWLYQALVLDSRKAALGSFISFLADHEVLPHEVSDGHTERFAEYLDTCSLRNRPNDILRGAIRGWNAAIDAVPGWPPQRLTLPGSNRKGYVLPAGRFSPAFQASVAEYLAYLADPPEHDDAPLRPLRPTTLRRREFQLRQAASALVHRGLPIESLTCVTDLATRDNIDRICDFFIEHHGRPDGSQLDAVLQLLRRIALQHLKDQGLAQGIRRRMLRLSGPRWRRMGMTEKNRRRLAVFRDPHQIRDLLFLPYRLLKRAESGTLSSYKAAVLVRTAVAIELEIMCPIRLQNLSELNADTDFVRSRSGKDAAVHLFIPGQRTKNGEDIELELPKTSMALIDLYLAKYRTTLIKPEHRGSGPRYLFPKPDGTAKEGCVLAASICEVMQRELGIKFNVHLFRHLGCFLYLRSHPGQIDVMRRVLGHRDVATTTTFYASIEHSEAFRRFDTHILQLREDSLRPSRRISRNGGRR